MWKDVSFIPGENKALKRSKHGQHLGVQIWGRGKRAEPESSRVCIRIAQEEHNGRKEDEAGTQQTSTSDVPVGDEEGP